MTSTAGRFRSFRSAHGAATRIEDAAETRPHRTFSESDPNDGIIVPGYPSEMTWKARGGRKRGTRARRSRSRASSFTSPARSSGLPHRVAAPSRARYFRPSQIVAAAYDRAADSYTLAIKGFDDLVTSLAADKGGAPLAVLVADEKRLSDLLAEGAYLLFVRLNSAAGANYTKKNLWTFFGAMPFYVMGGAVVSYVVMNGQTEIAAAAGQIPIHSGYHKVKNVADEFKSDYAAPSQMIVGAGATGQPAQPK